MMEVGLELTGSEDIGTPPVADDDGVLDVPYRDLPLALKVLNDDPGELPG